MAKLGVGARKMGRETVVNVAQMVLHTAKLLRGVRRLFVEELRGRNLLFR